MKKKSTNLKIKNKNQEILSSKIKKVKKKSKIESKYLRVRGCVHYLSCIKAPRTYRAQGLTGPKDLQGPRTYRAQGLAEGLRCYKNFIFLWRTALSQLLQTFILLSEVKCAGRGCKTMNLNHA